MGQGVEIESESMKQEPLGHILIVDDEQELLEVISDFLSLEGYEIAGFTSASDALAAVRKREFDILITDLVMPGMGGIELLRACKEIDPDLIGIIMTGWGTIQTTVEAMKAGAFDYLLKPFKMDHLPPIIARAMQVRQLRRENIELRGTMAVYELTRAINVTQDVGVIAGRVADAVLEQCRADEVSVMLPTEEGSELYIAAIRGDGRERLLGTRVGLSVGIAGWVARHRETLLLEGAVTDPRFRPVAARPEILSAISLPLVAGGNFVGVLNINALRRGSFTPGQIRALNVIVGMAAPAIENSALFSRMQAIEAKYRDIVENSVEGIFQITREGRMLMANPSLARILGYESTQELLAASRGIFRQVFADRELNLRWMQEIEKLGEIRNIEARILRKDQSEVWVLINARAVRNRNGQEFYYEGALVDIGRQKEMEASLVNTARQWMTTFDSIHDVVWICDRDGTIQRCNKAAREYFRKSFPELVGRSCFEVIYGADPPGEDSPMNKVRLSRKRETQNLLIGERWYNITVDPILDESGGFTGAVHVVSDITVQKSAEEELRAMSLRDELTGLLNRRGFMNLAQQQLRLAQRMQKMLILFFIDLDRMKWINDTLGHPEGDRALQNAAAVLKRTFRESDLIARVGGDEFVVVTLNAFDESTETILARLEKNLAAFNAEHQGPYPLSLSIGAVSSEEEEAASIEALLQRADQRMYDNKKEKVLKKLP
jgi:diguanylate cyclase (GGDEF)-like protein/PAS domain S-box-containing protein